MKIIQFFSNCFYQACLSFLKKQKLFTGSVASLRNFVVDSAPAYKKYIDPELLSHLMDPEDEHFKGTGSLTYIIKKL